MRSFISLGHKGNILAILKQLLVENPLSFENNFGSQGVIESKETWRLLLNYVAVKIYWQTEKL